MPKWFQPYIGPAIAGLIAAMSAFATQKYTEGAKDEQLKRIQTTLEKVADGVQGVRERLVRVETLQGMDAQRR